jgi:hypothetical protein
MKKDTNAMWLAVCNNKDEYDEYCTDHDDRENIVNILQVENMAQAIAYKKLYYPNYSVVTVGNMNEFPAGDKIADYLER